MLRNHKRGWWSKGCSQLRTKSVLHFNSLRIHIHWFQVHCHPKSHPFSLWMGCGIQCMWIPLRIHIHWSQVHSHPDRQASGPLALKRRSRTPLYASSLPGRRHQVEIINEFRSSVKIINTRNQRLLCQQFECLQCWSLEESRKHSYYLTCIWVGQNYDCRKTKKVAHSDCTPSKRPWKSGVTPEVH